MRYAAMNYTLCGRKRKTNAWKAPKAKTMADFNWSTPSQNTVVRQTKSYPSAPMTPAGKLEDTSWKREESKNFTVAPAYNKGAYQVIPRSDVQHIGK